MLLASGLFGEMHQIGYDCNANGTLDSQEVVTQGDCNNNAVPDDCDPADGFSWDCNGNGVPDECDLANGDLRDRDGDGIPDDCECDLNPPYERPVLSVLRAGPDEVALTWDSVPDAVYDVIQGSLETLAATGGEFGVSVESCLADNQPSTLYFWDGSPAAGNGAYFLVRAVNCGGSGTYNAAGDGQDGLRDVGIDQICP
jgi:hypothetical protein